MSVRLIWMEKFKSIGKVCFKCHRTEGKYGMLNIYIFFYIDSCFWQSNPNLDKFTNLINLFLNCFWLLMMQEVYYQKLRAEK